MPIPNKKPSHHFIKEKKVHYVKMGKGSPLLLLHSGGSSWRDWEKIMPPLSNNFLVIAPDLPGMGESQEFDGAHSLEAYEQFVKDFLNHLKLDKEKVILMGFSLGGTISLKFATDYPDRVKKLVLISAAHYFPHPVRRLFVKVLAKATENGESQEKVKELFSKTTKKFRLARYLYHPRPGFVHCSPKVMREVLLTWAEARIPEEKIEKINFPVLLIAPEADLEVPVSIMEELGNLIPKAKILVVPGATHYDICGKVVGAGGKVDKIIFRFLSKSLISKVELLLSSRVLKSS